MCFFVTLNGYIYPSTVGSHIVYEASSYSMGIMAILEILNVCLLFLPFHQDLISYSSLNSVKGKRIRSLGQLEAQIMAGSTSKSWRFEV